MQNLAAHLDLLYQNLHFIKEAQVRGAGLQPARKQDSAMRSQGTDFCQQLGYAWKWFAQVLWKELTPPAHISINGL